MSKIKSAHVLVDQLLDECSCDAGKPMDQEEVAFQKDTLFDDPERIVKDKTDDEPSLNPVPNTEAQSFNVSKFNRDKQLASLSKKGEIPVIDATKNYNSENIKKDINEIFGFGKSVESTKKSVNDGTYKGSNKTFASISKNRKALADAMKG